MDPARAHRELENLLLRQFPFCGVCTELKREGHGDLVQRATSSCEKCGRFLCGMHDLDGFCVSCK